MNIKGMQKNWDTLGKTDPLWAILAEPGKQDKKWNIAEFFESGEIEVARVLEHVDVLHPSLSRDKALDFGCGVGRVTQALCHYFEQCYGIDIAPSMIDLAEKYNRHEDRCRYHTNTSSSLELFESDSFDFVYSRLVLQHMKPEYSEGYIRELFRILMPGGLLVFQIPSGPSYDALSPAGFKAQIIVQDPPLAAEPGSKMTIEARIKNISEVTWPTLSQIKLGNHWLDDKENPLRYDDGRVSLPSNVEPEEEITLQITITVPTTLISCILELDMVQEMVAWFKDRGSNTIKFRFQPEDEQFQVAPIRPHIFDTFSKIRYILRKKWPRARASKTDSVPRIEMYCIPRDKVLNLIDSCGGKTVDVQEDDSAGPGWVDFCYYVTKG